jgi:hypothetical protein
MKAALLYLSAPLLVALLAPMAVARAVGPYPAVVLVGTIPVVLLFTCLVALPLYFAMPKHRRGQLAPTLALAFLAGFLSFILFNLASPGASYSRVGEAVLVADGRLTAAGWRGLLAQSLWMGALSLPGGLLFWIGALVQRGANK